MMNETGCQTIQPFLDRKAAERRSTAVAWNGPASSKSKGQYLLFEQFRAPADATSVELVPDLMDTIMIEMCERDAQGIYYGLHRGTRHMTFRPGAEVFAVNFSAAESLPGGKNGFVDQVVPLEDFERTFKAFDYEGFQKQDFAARVQHFLAYMNAHFAPRQSDPVSELLQHVRTHGYGLSIEEASRLCGYSSRQLRNIFRDAIGLSPKDAVQILRFQETLRRMTQTRSTITDFAQELAFFDEAHFDKFFKKYSAGIPPNKFLKLASA
jgi:AraC-like DNA-binding protein